MFGDKILPKWNDVEIRWYNSDDGISVLFFFHSLIFRMYSETVKYNYAVTVQNTVHSLIRRELEKISQFCASFYAPELTERVTISLYLRQH